MTASLTRHKPAHIPPPEATSLSLPRRFVRATLFWLFGLSASILIGSLWGSAVVGNRNTVAEVVRDVVAEQLARERLVGWVAEGIGLVETLPGDSSTVDVLLAMPETEQVLVELTDQLVEAAFAPAGSAASVDPATALLPFVPQITRVLAAEGVPADESTVAALVADIEPIPLDGSGELPVASVATRASTALTLAAALAGVAMLILGGVAVLISPDRMAALRNLAYRLMLTSLSLALMLRLGSWIADPAGGSTPWREGLASLLGSHVHVPLLVAAMAAAIGTGAKVARQMTHRRERA